MTSSVQAVLEPEPLTALHLITPSAKRFVLLASIFSLLILFAHLFPQTGDGDAVMHYLNVRDSLWQPVKLMGSWGGLGIRFRF